MNYTTLLSLCFIFLLNGFQLFGQKNKLEVKPIIYLIPGQGADYRLFNNLELDAQFEVRYIHYETPAKGTSMKEYAIQLSKQIKSDEPFILIGSSLGGMLATEMGDFLDVEKIIIIGSAKSSDELPKRYTFQKTFPIYKLVSPRVKKFGAKVLQPIFEPDRNNEKETFKKMLDDLDPNFLSRTISMILEWDRKEYRKDIIHIHGEKDHTIPVKNVKYNYLIKDGSHVMTLTRGKELSNLINNILAEKTSI